MSKEKKSILDVRVGDKLQIESGEVATVTLIGSHIAECARYPYGWRSLWVSVNGKYAGAVQGNFTKHVTMVPPPVETGTN